MASRSFFVFLFFSTNGGGGGQTLSGKFYYYFFLELFPKEPNILNQIFSIKSAKQTKSTNPILQKIKVKSNPSLRWGWSSSAPTCFVSYHMHLNLLYFNSTWSGGCFAPTSTVETREGVKTMDELLIGDEIRTSENNLDNTGFTEVSYILLQCILDHLYLSFFYILNNVS